MEVWVVFPTANLANAAKAIDAWHAMGYRVACLLDGPYYHAKLAADLTLRASIYHGWATSINELADMVESEVVVAIGDDMYPDPKKGADIIQREFLDRFPDTYGVMQPTGDRFGASGICGSPWLGRAFCRRWNGGMGPFWPGYYHEYADTEMYDLTKAAGLLWQRPDLTHRHDHYMRRAGATMPGYMAKAYESRPQDKALYLERKGVGFPGHRPMPAA